MRTSFFLSFAAIFVSIASAAPLRGDVLEARNPTPIAPVADVYEPAAWKREEDAEERGYSLYGWKRSESATPAPAPTPATPKKVAPVEDVYYNQGWKREDEVEEKREEEERGYSMYGWKRQASASATPTPTPATKPKAPVADYYPVQGWKRDDAPEAAKRTPEEASQ